MQVMDCSLIHVTQTHYFKYPISFVTSCRRITEQNVADSAAGHTRAVMAAGSDKRRWSDTIMTLGY
jgi:hypothetical protein